MTFDEWMSKERRATLDAGPLLLREAYEAGQAAERERCAKLCEDDAERIAAAMKDKRRGVQELSRLALAHDEAAGLAQRIRGA